MKKIDFAFSTKMIMKLLCTTICLKTMALIADHFFGNTIATSLVTTVQVQVLYDNFLVFGSQLGTDFN